MLASYAVLVVVFSVLWITGDRPDLWQVNRDWIAGFLEYVF